MTIQQLKYIIKVAEIGSITEAAKALFISQPSLSNAIREIEKETKLTIFSRSRQGIALTKEGLEFWVMLEMWFSKWNCLKANI
jgi:DNA-binding transcriptional LysR family regulator